MENNYRMLGVVPVSQTEPCGKDVRYDDVFATLQQEMDKLASPSLRDTFSWENVADRASLILRDHSKDLLAASYLAVALTHMNGAQGLETGSWILRDLLTTHWDNLFPAKKRLKGRLAAIAWWVEKTEAAVDSGKIWGFDSESRDKVYVHLKAIDGFLKDYADDVTLVPLIRKVETLTPEDQPKTAKKTETPEKPKTIDVNMAEVSSISMSNEDDLSRNLAPLFQKIKQAAKLVSDDRPENPQSYRWLRFAIWEPLKSLPLAKDRITRIPPPTSQLIAHLESLERDEDWTGLLQASESALHSARNLFFLDLNRYSHTALSNMGNTFEQAGNAVFSETALFAERLAGVKELLFSDNTPFADERTKDWLKERQPENVGGLSGQYMGNCGQDALLQGDLADFVLSAKKTGKLQDTVSLFQKRLNESRSGKESLLLRLELVKLFASEKREKMASSQIEHIVDAVERHHLDIWEPELAFSALRTVFTALKSCPESRKRMKPDDVLVRLAKIDLGEAMKL